LQLTSDKDFLAVVAPLAIAFAKHLGSIYLPSSSSSSSADSSEPSAHDFPSLAESAQPEAEDVLVSREQKDKFRKLLVAYFEALGKREQRLHLVRRPFLSLSSFPFSEWKRLIGLVGGSTGTSTTRQAEP